MGKYVRKSNKGSYSKEKLLEAVQEVKNGRMSGYGASQKYQIPRMTIMDHVNKKRGVSTTLGRNTVLSPEIECKLGKNLHLMEKCGFGLTRNEVLEMVGDYVNENKIITPFKNGTPGKDWFLAFKRRQYLSLKKPQGVEYARKTAMDPFIVFPYFDLLEKTICDLSLNNTPYAIWNFDETSFSKDPSKSKIVGSKGHAATRIISSPGRDNTTVLLGVSASGEKTPPLIVYKGKEVWDTWTSPDAYPGTTYAATKKGWMESNVFENFFKKVFVPLVQDQRPVLLIYDGHSTHVGLNMIEAARKENITILKLPAHTSHVLQPLDVSVMKPFKDRWDPLLVQWQRLNIGNTLNKREFARLIGKVWREIDPQVVRNGFRKTGIFPVNRKEIKEDKFDKLKLKNWREFESKLHVSTEEQEIIERNPTSLLTIVLNFLNENLIREDFHITEEPNNRNQPLENTTQGQNVSFEELLLNKLKRGDNSPNPRRRKVAPGAEVITHDDVLKKKREEQEKIEKKRNEQNRKLSTCRNNKKEKKKVEQKKTKDQDVEINSMTSGEVIDMLQEIREENEENIQIQRKIEPGKNITVTDLKTKSKKGKRNKVPTQKKINMSCGKETSKNISVKDLKSKKITDKIKKEKVTTDLKTIITAHNPEVEINICGTLSSDEENLNPILLSKKMPLTENKTRKRRTRKTKKEKIKPAKIWKSSRSISSTSTETSVQMSVHSDSDIIDISDYETDVTYFEDDSDQKRVRKLEAEIFDEIVRRDQESSQEDKEEIDIEYTGKREDMNKSRGTEIEKTLKLRRKKTNKSTKLSESGSRLSLTSSKENPAEIAIEGTKKINKLGEIENPKPNFVNTEENTDKPYKGRTDELLFAKNTGKSKNKKRGDHRNIESAEKLKWNIGDTVMVRYYLQKTWKYHVGVIEAINRHENLYTISFYRTIKKKNDLIFVKTKREDKDQVSEFYIVKNVQLLQIKDNPDTFVFYEDTDAICF